MAEQTTPFFTVITPVYNCASYIAQTIGSLKAQTFGDFEAIIVDDCSTDDSVAVATRAIVSDPRFKQFALPCNSGQSAARNLALDKASGTVVVLLDADDLLAPDALEKIAERFRSQDLDELYFGAESFYQDAAAYKLLVEEFSNRANFDGVATGKQLFTFFEEIDQFYPHGALRAVKRSLLEENDIRFYEGIINEDLLFTFQTLLVAQRSSFLNEPLYRRRIRMGSTMSTKVSMKNVHGHLVSIHFMQDWMREHAEELDIAFITAMSHRLNDYLDRCAEDYLKSVDEQDKAAYLAKLTPAQRIEFEIEIAQRAAIIGEHYGRIDWRVGSTLCAAPRALKHKLDELKRKKG